MMTMKKCATRSLSAICAVICILSSLCVSVSASEPKVELRYTGISSLFTEIDISDSGRATCYGYAAGRSGYSVDLTLELQRDGRTIKKWSNNGTGEVEITETYFVTSGHDYQTIVSATVTDSRGNEFVESPSKSTVFHY